MRAMKPIAIYPPLSPESESAIKDLERALRIRLPEDYRCFLKTTGGGGVDFDNCWIDPAKHAQLPYSVLFSYLWTISEVQKAIKNYRGRIPYEMMPIGRDIGGDLFLLGYSAANEGIYYWDHEQEDAAYELIAQIPPLDRIQYFKVADSFTEFADMLERMPEQS